jgi:4-amino-4-deoxy-L-arabinose transferase-like glycosyltransferase
MGSAAFSTHSEHGPRSASGLVLALGYYAKAPFFPMGFVFVLCACFGRLLSRRMILLGGTVLALFILACAPYITAISLSKGHFTIGESARLSQAFYINDVEYYEHWQGGPQARGCRFIPLASSMISRRFTNLR